MSELGMETPMEIVPDEMELVSDAPVTVAPVEVAPVPTAPPKPKADTPIVEKRAALKACFG